MIGYCKYSLQRLCHIETLFSRHGGKQVAVPVVVLGICGTKGMSQAIKCLHDLQITTAEQKARAVVYAYPQSAKPEAMLNQLATERGEPSVQSLLDDTSVDDFQHAANWQEIAQYLTTVTSDNVHSHCRLLTE